MLRFSLPVASTNNFRPGLVGRPSVDLFVVVSIALHFLLIALIGDTSGTGERKAFSSWGGLNVRIATPAAEQGTGLKTDTKPLPRPSRRLPPPVTAPKAPVAAEPAATSPPLAAVPPPPIPVALALSTTLTQPSSQFSLPTPPVEIAEPPPAPAPKPIAAAPIESIRLAQVEREISDTKPQSRNIPLSVPVPITKLENARVETDFAPSTLAPLPVARAPMLPIEPIPAPRTDQAFASADEIKPATIQRAPVRPITPIAPISPPVNPDVAAFEAPSRLRVPPVARPAPSPIENLTTPPPVELAATSAIRPRELVRPKPRTIEPIETDVTTKPLELAPSRAVATRSIERSTTRVIETIAEIAAPSVDITPANVLRAREILRAAPRPLEPIGSSATDAGTGTIEFADSSKLKSRRVDSASKAGGSGVEGERASAGAPGRRVPGVPSIIDDVLRSLQPPSPPQVNAPSVNVDTLRDRARQIARGDTPQRPRALVPFPMFAQPGDRSAVERAFDKSLKRPDCRDQFAGMGLAAVLPLMLSTVRDDLCKW